MKESITKFDLEAAFKALDEIDMPNVGKVRANRPALNEIFSRKTKFDALMEEYYDINDMADLDDAKEAREAEVAQAKLARIEKIVDLDAESPEDLLPSYVGKFIMQCPQCMTLFYKDPADIEASEEDPDTVNVNEVCQHCGNEAGYTLIGKVGEATEEETADFNQEETVDVTSTDEDEEAFNDEALEEPSDEELDIDLDTMDLNIEDDEATEEEKTEESFTNHGGESLVEELREETELDVSADDFEKLINSPEFKKPISDSEARGMMNELDGESEKVEESTTVAEAEPADESENAGPLEEGVFDKLKDKFTNTVDKIAGKLKSRESKANWVLENARKDYGSVEVDDNGQPKADTDDRKFTTFVVIGYADKDTKGNPINIAPKFNDTSLVVGKNGVQYKAKYEDADKIAKGWSMQQGNGPAFIYMAKGKDDNNAAFLCEYFKGELSNDQLEKYFKVVKDQLKGAKLMQDGGATTDTEPEETTEEAPVAESLDSVMNDVEELEEALLEELISDSLVESYGNVAGFRLTECAYEDSKFIVDGTIFFTSGNKRKTSYVFSEALSGNDGRVSLHGINEKLGIDKLFTVTGYTNTNKTFIVESFKATKK